MVYCIMNDLPIDLAGVISRKIHEIANLSRDNRSLGFPLLITKLVHKKLRSKAPPIRVAIKKNSLFTGDLVYQMKEEQKHTLSLERPKRSGPGKSIVKKTAPRGFSSAAPTHDVEAPPAWAVEMQRSMEQNMMRIGGTVTRRLGDLQHDVEALWAAGQYEGQFRGMAPYTELEQHMMALSFGADQGEHAANGEDGDDAMT